MVGASGIHDLTGDLDRLATSLEGLTVGNAVDGDRLAARRDWVVRTIRGYIVPRLDDPARPMLVVFAGPTGAGKSTLLNSVAGGEHSVAGTLRPTTRSPLVLTSQAHADRYSSVGGVRCQVVVGRAPILDEITLIDTPDIDSTSVAHRARAETMIDNADIVIYVTSAARYADLVPWEVLRRALSRGAPVIQVMNRIKSSTSGALADYKTRLVSEGLESRVVPVHEHHMPRGSQLVPQAVIQELRDCLVEVVEARRSGSVEVVRSVLEATLDEAGDVISGASEMATASSDATAKARDHLLVDLDRTVSRIRANSNGRLDLEPLADLASKWFRTGWLAKRRVPSASAISMSHTLIDASLVTAVDADLRRQLMDDSLPPTERFLKDAHAAVGATVAAWHQDLDEMHVIRTAVDSSLASLVLARCCVEGADEEAEAVFELLTGPGHLAAALTEARERLAIHLMPVYASVEYHATARRGLVVATDDAIYRARVSLSAVMARSSFANA
jgi:hypothetical protein